MEQRIEGELRAEGETLGVCGCDKCSGARRVLSDHCDWPALLTAVKATQAEKVYATHGFTAAFSRYLNHIGIWSAEVKTEYGSAANAPDEADQ